MRPRTAGSIRKIDAGSTLRSSEPATGRSNVTLISAVGTASPAGVVRVTRSGAGFCACAKLAVVVRATARANTRRAEGIGFPVGATHGLYRPAGDLLQVADHSRRRYDDRLAKVRPGSARPVDPQSGVGNRFEDVARPALQYGHGSSSRWLVRQVCAP